MKQPIILAKSAMVKNQMQRKMDLGADGIEVQLLNELINDDDLTIKNLSKAFPNLDELLEFPVYSVHAPLCCYTEGVNVPPNIEVLSQTNFVYLYKETCRLADLYGERHDRIIRVVLHTEIDVSRSKIVNVDTLARIAKVTKLMLDMFPHINICIENVLPIRAIKDNGECILGSGFGFDNVLMVEYLRNAMPDYRNAIHTVYDTCHGEIAYLTTKKLNEYNDNIDYKKYASEEFFKNNKNTCDLIHLSKTVGNGMGKGKHGQPFKEGDEDIVFDYLDRYKKYNYNCPIVLEVAENNYDLSDGFGSSIKVVRNVLKKLVEK